MSNMRGASQQLQRENQPHLIEREKSSTSSHVNDVNPCPKNKN